MSMQRHCWIVHLLCTPMGIPITTQAVRRVRRLGQEKLDKVLEALPRERGDQIPYSDFQALPPNIITITSCLYAIPASIKMKSLC
jgi:hypothetical protein